MVAELDGEGEGIIGIEIRLICGLRFCADHGDAVGLEVKHCLQGLLLFLDLVRLYKESYVVDLVLGLGKQSD